MSTPSPTPPTPRCRAATLLAPLAWLLLAAGAACAAAPDDDPTPDDDPPVAPVTELDLPYPPPPGGDAAMSLLDLYHQPDGEPRRLLVFVHGGSWVGGDKGNLALAEDLVPWFLERGFVVAAPNFRLASPPAEGHAVTYAEQATDVAYALAWLRDHGADYGVTEPGAVLLGYSSGAHLVALLAADERYLASAGLSHGDLAGAISFDVHAYDVPYALQLMEGSVVENNIPLIEHLFGDTEEQQRIGSPSTYVAGTAVPPSLLVSAEPSAEVGSHGYITAQATQAHAARLQAAGREATWVHYDGETHSSLVMDFGQPGDGPTAAVEDFLGE